jgi:hypothetical protein
MPYLNCPNCRLTLYVSSARRSPGTCPRCSAPLGTVRSLFASPLRPALDTVIATRRARSSTPKAT